MKGTITMIQKLFAIYDSKAEIFNIPFFSQTTGTALRAFMTAANDEAHEFYRYGGDYTLFELGQVDLATAKITMLETPHNLGLAIAFVESSPSPSLQSVP